MHTMNTNYVNRKTSNGGDADDESTRKITSVPMLQPIQSQAINQFSGQTRVVTVSASGDAIENQLSGMFEGTQQNNFGGGQQTLVRQQVNATTISQVQQQQPVVQQKKPIKIYKCMSCDFKTTDIKLFQPHYDTCRQQNGYRCKLCKKLFANVSALKAHNAEKHVSEFTCSICSINYLNDATYKNHMETNHPDIKTIETSSTVSTGLSYFYSLIN